MSFDELASPLRFYSGNSHVVRLPRPTSSGGICGRVLRIPSPAAGGSGSTDLLARLAYSESASPEGPFGRGVLYLHGFPDQSLDHRAELPDFGSFCSRFPKKLAESVCKALPDAMFVAFNFAGTPGSHQDVPFCAKTVSREVCDAEAVIRFLRHGPLPPLAPLVIVGLSTGAIVASLLRGHSSAAVVAVAGALDVERALHLDFDAAQLHDFASGHCLKEFWLPEGSPSNPPVERCVDGLPSSSGWKKHFLRLDAAYRDDFMQLDIRKAVARRGQSLLVVHGSADTHVPIEHGEELFESAAEPKEFLVLRGANHFLSSTSDFKKMANAVITLASQSCSDTTRQHAGWAGRGGEVD